MANGKDVNQELDFEKKIEGMEDRQLLHFIARQNYDTCLRCEDHANKILALDARVTKIASRKSNQTGFTKKQSIFANIGTLIAAVIIALVGYFKGS